MFAVDVMKLVNHMPRNRAGGHIAKQVLRSGTSPAPNYAEARGAESRNDFVHKLKVVLKELNETHIWLQIIQRTNLIKPQRVQRLANECIILSRIINASIQTTVRRKIDNRPLTIDH